MVQASLSCFKKRAIIYRNSSSTRTEQSPIETNMSMITEHPAVKVSHNFTASTYARAQDQASDNARHLVNLAASADAVLLS
jgi:hypothetical protein